MSSIQVQLLHVTYTQDYRNLCLAPLNLFVEKWSSILHPLLLLFHVPVRSSQLQVSPSWCSLQSFSCHHYTALLFHIRWWITIRHCIISDWSQLMLLLYRNAYCVWVWLRSVDRTTKHMDVIHSVIVLVSAVFAVCLVYLVQSLGGPSPLCILELSRQIHIDMAVKNTTIFIFGWDICIYTNTLYIT